jgi:N-acyl homoserine lactone hydrolase
MATELPGYRLGIGIRPYRPLSYLLASDYPGSYDRPVKPLAKPPAWSQPLPAADPPPGMAIYQLPTGTYETPAALAVRGGSFRDKRHFAASAILVRHPKGDLLIDAGFGADLAAHIAMLPRFMRSAHHVGRTAGEQLDAAGYDRRWLVGVVLTHSHWDHASGLDSLPGTPIWMNVQERRHASGHWDGKVFRHVSRGRGLHEYGFDDRPYLGFPSSYDVHGDGSMVIVHAGGHTAGSVIVFVTVPSGTRYAFIGDLTWQLDGIRRRVERPRLMSKIADHDPGQVRQDLLRMIALDGLMHIVPTHDHSAYEGIPMLTPEHAEPPR